MSKPFFSIVLPTWNRAAMLRDALGSLRDQSFGDFEVIVVDNHSTDETRSAVEDFKDSRFVYRYPERKLSQLDCYAYGWNLARGIYSGTLDDDNVLRRDCLKKVHEVLSFDPTGLICFDRGLIYHVADHPNTKIRNTLDIHGFSGDVTRYDDGPDRIRRMCETLFFEQPYPGITNSFCRTIDVQDIFRKHTDIFPGQCIGGEEVFSVLVLDRFGGCIFLDEPLCVYGESGRNSTAELVSGKPKQQEFRDWYDGTLAIALKDAPIGLPLYPNFSLYGIRQAKRLLGLPYEVDWKEYYWRCQQWIGVMQGYWQVDPTPLMQALQRDLKRAHPELVDAVLAGPAPREGRPLKVASQTISGEKSGFASITEAARVLDQFEHAVRWWEGPGLVWATMR